LTYTKNHWSNEQTDTIYEYNTFKGQTTQSVLQVLEENNILAVEIPPNCTNQLQPLDLAVKPLKDQIKRHFHQWYSQEVKKRIKNAKTSDDKVINLKLGQLKSLGFKWLVEACAYVE